MKKIEQLFDEILYQFDRGITYEMYNKGIRHVEFTKIKEWESKFGYTLNIYSNDHLIDNLPHFHFDNKGKNISSKIDFNGNVLECYGNIQPKILKHIIFFINTDNIKDILYTIWNEKNPNLKIT